MAKYESYVRPVDDSIIFRNEDGSTEVLNSGCVVDGHWGWYGTYRALEEYGSLLGTDLLEELPKVQLTHCMECKDLVRFTDWPNGIHAPRSNYNHPAYPYIGHGPYESIDHDKCSDWIMEYEEENRNRINEMIRNGSYEWSDGELFCYSDRTWSMQSGEPFWEDSDYVWTRSDALWALTHDEDGIDTGGLYVPGSPYGRTSEDVAPVAYRMAYLLARESGEPMSWESLDHCMSLVVNDYDEVPYIIRTYGHGHYR